MNLFEQTENLNSNFFCFFKYLHSQKLNRNLIHPFVVRIRPLSPESRSWKCHGGYDLLKISKWNILEETVRKIGLQNCIKTFPGMNWLWKLWPYVGRYNCSRWNPGLQNLLLAWLLKLSVLYMFYYPYACWTSSDVSLSNGFEIKTLTNFRYLITTTFDKKITGKVGEVIIGHKMTQLPNFIEYPIKLIL